MIYARTMIAFYILESVFFKKLKTELPYDAAISLLDIYPPKMKMLIRKR